MAKHRKNKSNENHDNNLTEELVESVSNVNEENNSGESLDSFDDIKINIDLDSTTNEKEEVASLEEESEDLSEVLEDIKEDKRNEALIKKQEALERLKLEREAKNKAKAEKKAEVLERKKQEFLLKAERKALERNKTEENRVAEKAERQRRRILKNPRLSRKLKSKLIEVERFEPSIEVGLTSDQVDTRIHEGLNNCKNKTTTRSIPQIILGNLFTFFNMLIFVIAAFLISVNSIKDLTFLIIVLANMVIGTVQEIMAKKTIDQLSLISAPGCEVLRDGKKIDVKVDELVLDDLMFLSHGKQICSDSIVVEGTIEVNESLLTGESDEIVKHPGDTLYSGSFVVSGNCLAKVDKVGADNYIEKLTGQAKQYKKPNSALMKSLSLIIIVMAFLIIPIGLGLGYIQYVKTGMTWEDTVRKTAGAMIGMIPSGLHLVTSVALAVGVLRLSKNNVLVQELYCIEMLARIDVLCLDKTGTITDGSMNVRNVIDYNIIDNLSTKDIVSAMLNATNDNNFTNVALEEKFGRAKRIKHIEAVPFSSQRKFSAVTFEQYGTFLLGAPEFVMKNDFKLVEKDVTRCAMDGYRVLIIAHTKQKIEEGNIPQNNLTPVALILIEDNVRPDAIKTISYFKESGVEVKVISGDNPITVAKVSERAGIEHADQFISLDGMSDADVVRAATKYTVFGRVSPAQKRLLVKTLQELDHKVAMTGDGVNDILALREADCSIAIASGSEAARNVSHLVLLDSNFDSMPKVVAEGRRVTSNVARVAKLYLTKTIFSLLLAIVALIQGRYPISTNQLLMIDLLCIGIPSVALVLEPNNSMAPKKFLQTIIKSAAPGALVIVIESLIVFMLQYSLDMTSRITSTIICVSATYTCMMVLLEACKPFITNMRKILFGSLFAGFIFATLFLPSFFDFAPIAQGLSYYSPTEEVIKWNTREISVSESNHYTVDGYVLTELAPRQTSTHTVRVDSRGYLVVDGLSTSYKPLAPVYSSSVDDKIVIGGEEIKNVKFSSDFVYTTTVNPQGDLTLVANAQDGRMLTYSTGLNVLPKVTVVNNLYYVNDFKTDTKSVSDKVGKVTLDSEFNVYVDSIPLTVLEGENRVSFKLFKENGITVSHKNESIYLFGEKSNIDYADGTIEISNQTYSFINAQTGDIVDTLVEYKPEIGTTESGYYIVDGWLTNYQCKSNGLSISQAITSDGYLKIDGQVTNISVEYSKSFGSTVAPLPTSAVILLICLCFASHPLIALINEVVPFTKKQINKLVEVLNRL